MSPPTSSPSGAATAAARPEPRRADGRDRASAGRAEELGGEPLLAERGQRLQPDERQVEEDRGGDDEVGHGRSRITGVGTHATSARIASPVSSALVTKPRAPDSATSGPKSEPSRLDARTIARPRTGLAQPRGDLEPVDVRQLDVEQHDVRCELERRGDARTLRRSPCRRRRSRRSRARPARSPGTTDGRRRSTRSRARRVPSGRSSHRSARDGSAAVTTHRVR